MFRVLKPLSTLALLVLLAGCLFKTETPVIGPGEGVLVPVQTGYLYGVDKRDGSVIAQKFEQSANAVAKEYLLYDEVAAKQPFILRFVELGGGVYLAQSQNPELEARKVSGTDGNKFEYQIVRIKDGAGYLLDGEASHFEDFVNGSDPAVFQGESDGMTAALEVKDKAKFMAALKAYVKKAVFKPDAVYYDASGMKRLHPDKALPK